MGCSTSSQQEISHPTIQQRTNSRQDQPSSGEYSDQNFGQENKLDFNCPSGHPLFRVHNNLYKQNIYNCDMCGKNKNVQAEPSAHCPECEFDICTTCFQAQPDSHYTCVSNHQLYRITSREVVRSGKTCISNRYVCDLCGRIRNAKDDSTYRCPLCDFDMCPLCFRQQHKSEYFCPSGHHLFKVSDLKTFHDGKAYNNNTYGCYFCRKILESEEHPATHCPECRYDVCPNCVRTNFMGSSSRDNLSEQDNGSNEESISISRQRKLSKKKRHDSDENSKEIDSKMACVVCLTENRSHIFEPCKHLSTCESCSWMFYNDKKPCPICRREIKNVVKIYVA